MTLADFYNQRFEPEHVNLQKPSTRDYYGKMWRNHIAPLLGDRPLRSLDEDRIFGFRAALHGRMAASTANVVLSKLGKLLRFARKLKAIDVVPSSSVSLYRSCSPHSGDSCAVCRRIPSVLLRSADAPPRGQGCLLRGLRLGRLVGRLSLA